MNQMGLNDIVSSNVEKSKELKSTDKDDLKTSGELVYNKVVKPREPYGDPIDCSYCEKAISIPVKGLVKHGSLYRCPRIFCDNSIIENIDQIETGRLNEIREEMLSYQRERFF